MKSKYVILFLLIPYIFIACNNEQNCFIADSIVNIKTINNNGNNYVLYLRITGFNKKEHFYELYNETQKFDDCGKSSNIPISEIHIDSTKGSVRKLMINNNKLDIIYSKLDSNLSNLQDVIIYIR